MSDTTSLDKNPKIPVVNPDDIKIENIVATVVLDTGGDKIDLVNVARVDVTCEYKPERFPGLVTRFQSPKATTLLFSTGKVVITGLTKEENAQNITERVMKLVEKSGTPVKNPEITIQNIVATCDLGKSIDLNMCAVVLENTMYEPEVFPGLVIRMKDPKTVFLVFSTGKTVCTGLKRREDLKTAYDRLINELAESSVFKEEGAEFNDFF